jgi:hypothetical protein
MYLTEIDPKTGFLSVGKSKDGILAIKEFREILNNEDLGLPCLTAIALVVDYLSPKRFYDENDRPRAAMEETTGDRDKWPWKNEIIQKALIKYNDLQYDSDAEEERLHRQRKVNTLRKIKECENLTLEEQVEKGYNKSSLLKDLRNINKDIDEFNKRINKSEIYKNSPVENGYSLSRIEQKLLKKRSHYNIDAIDT